MQAVVPSAEGEVEPLDGSAQVGLQGFNLHPALIVILAKAARGEPPGPEFQKDSDSVRASICPYRGLLHFREEDAPFFFGRAAAIKKLLETVQRHPFVAVVGASGSG